MKKQIFIQCKTCKSIHGNHLFQGNGRHVVYQDISIERKPFVWRTLQEHNETYEITCRNSLQGKSILVDDRGNMLS